MCLVLFTFHLFTSHFTEFFIKFIKETIITGIAYWTLNLKEMP